MRISNNGSAYFCSLFSGISRDNIDLLMAALKGRTEVFYKNEGFFGKPGEICYVLSGTAYAYQLDYWGSRSILFRLSPGSMLVGQALPGFESTEVSAVATTTVTALFIRREPTEAWRYAYLLPELDKFRTNFATTLAGMYLALLQKHYVAEQRSIRDKILAFLSPPALAAKGEEFNVEMSRQEMADYLYVDRCALCHELSRMQAEGLITYHKKKFRICALK